jgi:hypothetical protein
MRPVGRRPAARLYLFAQNTGLLGQRLLLDRHLHLDEPAIACG